MRGQAAVCWTPEHLQLSFCACGPASSSSLLHSQGHCHPPYPAQVTGGSVWSQDDINYPLHHITWPDVTQVVAKRPWDPSHSSEALSVE